MQYLRHILQACIFLKADQNAWLKLHGRYDAAGEKIMLKKLLAAASLGFAFTASAQAQDYPNKQINLIVPFAAGGPSDLIARMVSKVMSDNLGQQIIVENVAGAGGTAGAQRVAKAAPDGYTLLIHHLALAAGASLYNNPGYDTLTAFQPVGLINYGPFVLLSKKDYPTANLAALLTKLKADGEKVTVAHAGVGSGSHLCGMMLSQALGAKFTLVPYRGTGPAMNDLVGGQVDILCDQTTNAMAQVQGGTVKAYAVTAPQAISQLPDLPPLASQVPGFDLSVWHGIYGPKGVSAASLTKLNAALQKALADEAVQKRFAELGTLLFPATERSPEALQAKLDKEVKHWSVVVTAAGVPKQ
jgi:tripartite-type tricarboxylate transporter receptor subunit TctC